MNFEFLKQEWSELYESAGEAEKQVFSAPRVSAFYSRLVLETGIRWVFDNDSSLTKPYQDNLSTLMYEQTFQNLLPPGVLRNITYIRKLGNVAAHQKSAPSSNESLAALQYLHSFLHWLVRTYSKTQPNISAFNETLLPSKGEADKSVTEIQKLQLSFDYQRQELHNKEKLLLQSEDEKARLEKRLLEIQAQKEKNKEISFVTESAYTEDQTRKQFIDVLLKEAGWDIQGSSVTLEHEVSGMPNKEKKGYVDYVLWGDDGLPLAVVEAKKTMHDPHKGKHQAELYADCLEKITGQRPVIFYTNGFESWIWDDHFYPPRAIQGFYTKDELQLIINRRENRKELSKQTLNVQVAGRYYQQEAIKRIIENLEGKARASLLVMATGSGKTRTAAALVDLLMKANWVRRVLFLADRNALVTQAKNNFNEYLPHLTTVDLTKEKEDSTSRMVFSTYPTIMNRIDAAHTDDNRFYGTGHFDLIIVDEAHRSVYMKYKAIFDYFDAIRIGLTATPKAEVDKNTYELFNNDSHNPTYNYELTKAVKDKWLVPPKAISVPIKFHREGIKYDELSDEEKAEYELTFRDEVSGNMPEEIDSSALNNWLFNANTVDKVLSYLMEHGLKVEGGDKLGKTIIFAKSHKHALFIQQRFDLMFPHLKGKFLRIIDNYETYAQDLLDNFSEVEKFPQIAVSVDMLDTGIDIPEIVNLVFFKIVRSSAKFWQMIGRGTRLCKDLFGPGYDKECFYIFDFCENFEFFNQFPEGIDPPMLLSITQRIFRARLRLSQELRESNFNDAEHQSLRKELLDVLHAGVAKLDTSSFVVRPHLRFVDKFAERNRWDSLSQGDIIDIERELSQLITPDSEDEFARRFDLLMLNLQLALIDKSTMQKAYMTQVTRIAKDLSRKNNIPSVAAKAELISLIQTQNFWKAINITALEKVRVDIRDLVKFIDKEERPIVYTNFEDEIDHEAVVAHDILVGYQRMESYKQRVESFIRKNQNHITISRLKNNHPITTSELEELERILFSEDRGTKDDYIREFGDKPLGVFIRSLIGLDVTAAKTAFADFLTKGKLKADQMTFINNIIDFLTVNGTIDKAMLFESPFTDINDQGLLGVFDADEASRIIHIIDDINSNAVTA
jgi:type I restriction enzyme R subunit